MKKLTILSLLFFLLSPMENAHAQEKVEFTYDAAGNRLSGKTISMLRSDKEDIEEEMEVPTGLSEVLSEHIIRIYPNPTKGLIRIDLENMRDNEQGLIHLYDLSGKRIVSKENIVSSTEIDITPQPEGVYILRIMIGESSTEWKIVKQ